MGSAPPRVVPREIAAAAAPSCVVPRETAAVAAPSCIVPREYSRFVARLCSPLVTYILQLSGTVVVMVVGASGETAKSIAWWQY